MQRVVRRMLRLFTYPKDDILLARFVSAVKVARALILFSGSMGLLLVRGTITFLGEKKHGSALKESPEFLLLVVLSTLRDLCCGLARPPPTTAVQLVLRVRFLESLMFNVKFPLIIDQHYCPHNINCPSQESGVRINDVIYQGIKGTSATKIAVKLDCSAKAPCTRIRMKDIILKYANEAAQSSCVNVLGNALSLFKPQTCF
ncbi:hypothetical protein Bca52824_027045 [Brassica carinata]|uniref:Uncharacterized protein n=1 Tax=Brassica carinata TaxID=52824 RepID=A0A8X7SJ75_BRACI|nr:hypothetical protein Bca52824_027045 [Brassica carinata]